MPRVTSSAVSWIGYDEGERTLFVRLSDGELYSYDGVRKATYVGLLKAESKASFLAEKVWDRFPCRRLDEDFGEALDGASAHYG